MIAGMDFGTTNSGMAIYEQSNLRILPLDPGNENARVLRTALYITNEQEVVIGRAAVDRYFEQNVGRSVKLEKVWVGELEVYGADMYFVTDTYVWADVMSPGRLFLSFKTNLRDHEYAGTVIGQQFYPIESLVALYLTVAKKRAERLLGRELREVVLGRPVRFATDTAHDSLAQERLLRGAFAAGYERVYLAREPIAAAYDYASRTHGPQNILVFDFGGGTLDLTVMRVENGTRRVLATGGVPIAGDVFDQKLVRAKLPKHFGEGSTYGPRNMPAPKWIYDLFSNWQTILELQTPQNLRVLQDIERGARRPSEIRALISVVSGNHALEMFDRAEQAKRDLSERFGSMIRLKGEGFSVTELVTRREFENIIRSEVHAIERELDDIVAASGLRPKAMDAVIRTGGSAQIPVFQELLREKFGADRLQALDTFSSVTAGLGIIGHEIEKGTLDYPAMTSADLTPAPITSTKRTRPNVQPVNLELLQRRIALQESGEQADSGRQLSLVVLNTENELTVWNAGDLGEDEPFETAAGESALLAGLLTPLDERLLLITSRYRFLLLTPREIRDAQSIGLQIADQFQFAANEKIFTLASWRAVRSGERMVLVTSLGFVRPFPTDVLVNAIESPVPWSFDNPLPGWPLAMLPTNREDQVVLVTARGRALRVPLARVPLRGYQALNRHEKDTITGILVAQPDHELLVVTAGGHARRMPASAIETQAKANSPGKSIISRQPVQGVTRFHESEQAWALSSRRLLSLDPSAIPIDAHSTRSYLLKEIQPQENVRLLLTVSPHNPH